MARQTPSEVAERLRKQRQDRQQGKFIKNKGLKGITLRLVPSPLMRPAVLVKSVYLPGLKKTITSPETFGHPDPLLNYLYSLDKEDYQLMKKEARYDSKWTAYVVEKDNEIRDGKLNLRVFKFAQGLWDNVESVYTGEEDLEGLNIIDPLVGCAFRVKREGEGLDTEWSVTRWFDPEPICDDEAILATFESDPMLYDIRKEIKTTDWALMREAYESVTGEEMPDEYEVECEWPDDMLLSGISPKKSGKKTTATTPAAKKSPAKKVPAKKVEPEEPEEPTVEVGTVVSFETEDGVLQGDVVGIEGTTLSVNTDDGVYEVDLEYVTMIDGDEPEEAGDADGDEPADEPAADGDEPEEAGDEPEDTTEELCDANGDALAVGDTVTYADGADEVTGTIEALPYEDPDGDIGRVLVNSDAGQACPFAYEVVKVAVKAATKKPVAKPTTKPAPAKAKPKPAQAKPKPAAAKAKPASASSKVASRIRK